MRVLVLILASSLALSGCGGINVPYFQNMSTADLCGDFPKPYCQPQSSTNWEKIDNGIDYAGIPTEFLGTRYSSIFQRRTCISGEIPSIAIRNSGINSVQGILEKNSIKDLSNKLSADFIELLQNAGLTVPAQLSAAITSEVTAAVNSSGATSISLDYRRIDLTPAFLESVAFENCVNNLPNKERVITGISVITVSGNFASQQLTTALANVEASAAYSNLSTQAKAVYDNTQNRILNGQFSPVGFVSSVAFREKE